MDALSPWYSATVWVDAWQMLAGCEFHNLPVYIRSPMIWLAFFENPFHCEGRYNPEPEVPLNLLQWVPAECVLNGCQHTPTKKMGHMEQIGMIELQWGRRAMKNDKLISAASRVTLGRKPKHQAREGKTFQLDIG